jgi:hypothetical protein
LEAERGQFAVPILKPPADKDPEKQAEFEKQMSRQAFSHRLEIARQNVRAKTTRRLTKLNNSAARMRNAVLRNAPSNRQAQSLSKGFNKRNRQKI